MADNRKSKTLTFEGPPLWEASDEDGSGWYASLDKAKEAPVYMLALFDAYSIESIILSKDDMYRLRYVLDTILDSKGV